MTMRSLSGVYEMLQNRRTFVGATTSLIATALYPRKAFSFAEENLPTPDFTYDEENPPFVAGVRPYRLGTFRLDAEISDNRLIVHNYGHGGAGAVFERKTIADKAEMLTLDEDIIINCTGLGAREVAGDPNMIGIKGQLVWLPPQPHLQYLYQDHGYIFPRGDVVVVGGTSERGVENTVPDPVACRRLLAHAQSTFLGQIEQLKPFPDHINF
jgi:hypothetical protein